MQNNNKMPYTLKTFARTEMIHPKDINKNKSI